MPHEERIASLEQELRQLRENFAETSRIHQELGGESRMYEAAVHALILSHPDPLNLKCYLETHLSQVETGVVAVANTEEHLRGVQQAQSVLMLAVSEAIERYQADQSNPKLP